MNLTEAERQELLAGIIAYAVMHDDLSAKIRAAQILNYQASVPLSLVYRVAYLVRDEALAAYVPDFPPMNGASPE
jgi:hypothetical protein